MAYGSSLTLTQSNALERLQATALKRSLGIITPTGVSYNWREWLISVIWGYTVLMFSPLGTPSPNASLAGFRAPCRRDVQGESKMQMPDAVVNLPHEEDAQHPHQNHWDPVATIPPRTHSPSSPGHVADLETNPDIERWIRTELKCRPENWDR